MTQPVSKIRRTSCWGGLLLALSLAPAWAQSRFPDAPIKFFLTASIDERAKRRLAELEAQDSDTVSFEELKEQIRLRDQPLHTVYQFAASSGYKK
jgi:hypothetical protein